MKAYRGKTHNTVFMVIGAFFTMAIGSAALSAECVLFQLNGLDYSESELPPALQLALYDLENDYYQNVEQILSEALLDIYLQEESERLGKSKKEIKAKLLAVEKPDEKSIRAFYKIIKDRIKKPYQAVRKQIAEHLHQQRMDAKKLMLVADYQAKNDFKISLPRPTPPFVKINTEGFPIRGNPNAKITIVEFADYQCSHCKTASETIKKVAKRFKDQVKVIYMDFPVLGSETTQLVAQGAVCADKQGKFWAFHDLAYQHQDSLNRDSPIALAKEIGLDLRQFKDCLHSKEAAAKVARAEGEAKRLQLNSTPTVFVNGKRVILHDIEQDIIKAIERELAK